MFFQSDRMLTLGVRDKKFLAPVLPDSKCVFVKLTSETVLQVPQGTPYSIPTMKIWNTPEGEYRLYSVSGGEKPYILSLLSENSTVHVMVRKQEWSVQKGGFDLWSYIHLEELLLQNHGLVLHSASIIYRKQGILFTAPSGTGKTTQTNLWHKYCENVTDINGDRTLLQWTSRGWYACGFPVSGSSGRCEQAAVPIKAIVIIRQAEKDEVIELTEFQRITLLYSEITVPVSDDRYVTEAFNQIEQLAEKIPVVQLNCTMKESAVRVLHQYLYGD